MAVGVIVGGVVVAAAVVGLCVCCSRRGRGRAENDPDRPVYKIYVNNAYIQEEDGEIKVVSNGKLVDDKEPSQVCVKESLMRTGLVMTDYLLHFNVRMFLSG